MILKHHRPVDLGKLSGKLRRFADPADSDDKRFLLGKILLFQLIDLFKQMRFKLVQVIGGAGFEIHPSQTWRNGK